MNCAKFGGRWVVRIRARVKLGLQLVLVGWDEGNLEVIDKAHTSKFSWNRTSSWRVEFVIREAGRIFLVGWLRPLGDVWSFAWPSRDVQTSRLEPVGGFLILYSTDRDYLEYSKIKETLPL